MTQLDDNNQDLEDLDDDFDYEGVKYGEVDTDEVTFIPEGDDDFIFNYDPDDDDFDII